MDMPRIHKYVSVLNSIIAEHIPAVYNHLASLDIPTEFYIIDWILTLFSKVPRQLLSPLLSLRIMNIHRLCLLTLQPESGITTF